MNWLDIVIIVIVTLPTFLGYRKGFLRKLLGIVGILGGFLLAVRFYQPLADLLTKYLSADASVAKILSYLIIIAIMYGLAVWAATFMANINSGTKSVDKIAGAITGLLQGLIISSILLVNLTSLDLPQQKIRDSSLLYSQIYKIAPAIFDRVINIAPGIKNTYEEYKQLLIKK